MFEFIDNITTWEIVGKFAVGLILLRLLFYIARDLYGSFIASALGLNADITSYGKWVVITGSTDGIGKAFAFELARKGLNIVLISRSLSKLKNVAAEITEKYPIETRIIDVDFTSLDIYDRIRSELENIEVGVLINNVGMTLPFPEYFDHLDDKVLTDLMACNMMSMTMMTKMVVPAMKKRNKGMIINVSSLGALIPCPLLAIYGATKAFMNSLSESLSVELRNTGVEIQCLCPGYVVSNMSKIKRPTVTTPTPADYVRACLATTGVELVTPGYPIHKIMVHILQLSKKYMPSRLNKFIFNYNRGARKRYYQRLAAKKE